MKQEKNYELVRKMITTNKMHKQAIETVVDDIGIHRGRHLILMNLAKAERFSSQKEMAERLQITQAAMTVSLSKLERDGLISRKTGADSRYNEIEITEKGKEIVERSKSHFATVDSKVFLGIDEDELVVFEKCLDKMYANLSAFLGKDKI